MAVRMLADRYELESKLGSGGMGTVWKAKDTLLARTVAVKLLHEGLASDAAFAERFRREARNAASLAHPNVVTVYDTGEDDPPGGVAIPFIVMEFIQGESLHQRLNRQGPLAVEDTARIGQAILSGLAHAHSRGLVHRDMKPANVLLGTGDQPKVVDFGIAKGLEDTAGLTKTSGLIGTAAYLSPEQVDGHDATPASDQYALGCLLYACLAGEPPFSGNTPVAIAMKHLRDAVPSLIARRPDVPPDFEAAVMRALEKDPNKRFGSVGEMQQAIEATGLASRPASEPTVVAAAPTVAAVRAHPVGGPAQGTEVVQRAGATGAGGGGYRWLPALTAFLVVAAAAAIAVLWLQNRPTKLEEATLPTPSATVAAVVSAEPTASPTEAPDETERPQRTPCISVPGLSLGCPETPAPTPTPSLSASPSPSPGPT